MTDRHAILVSPETSGIEHGMLLDFQSEIARLTGSVAIQVPPRNRLTKRFGLGTRYAPFRRIIRRNGFSPRADVLWAVLMGPEDYSLDVFRRWDRHVGFKILYLFDTMERQLPSIRAVLRSVKWDLTITSFQGAVPFLEEETQRQWFAVPQGVKLDRFRPAPAQDRLIDFSAYGRRLPAIHEAVKAFCAETGRYYDYTTTAGLMPGTDPTEQYDQYAWRLRHSGFTFCWPVETTNPDRVRTFSPITCRWFEAAASGTVVVGQPPKDAGFEDLFGSDFVLPLDTACPQPHLCTRLRRLLEERSVRLDAARQRYDKFSHTWSWSRRVEGLLQIAGLDARPDDLRVNEPCIVNGC
jgi:hypothetical protein